MKPQRPALPRLPAQVLAHGPGRGRRGGFSMLEVMVVVAVAAVLAAVVLPSYQASQLRAGRMDAVDALTRVQVAQEQFRGMHGLYSTEFGALRGTAADSPQGRYRITLALTGPEGYVATATAQGPQAKDPDCATLTLEVERGYPREGPSTRCWPR
jgi:type IV pilus assembly protein PilE